MARQMLKWLDLPIKMGTEAVGFVRVSSVFHGWSSGAPEVKLSAAVATHSIPLQYIHGIRT